MSAGISVPEVFLSPPPPLALRRCKGASKSLDLTPKSSWGGLALVEEHSSDGPSCDTHHTRRPEKSHSYNGSPSRRFSRPLPTLPVTPRVRRESRPLPALHRLSRQLPSLPIIIQPPSPPALPPSPPPITAPKTASNKNSRCALTIQIPNSAGHCKTSPPTPFIPQLPSPATAQRRRVSKVRRYFGIDPEEQKRFGVAVRLPHIPHKSKQSSQNKIQAGPGGYVLRYVPSSDDESSEDGRADNFGVRCTFRVVNPSYDEPWMGTPRRFNQRSGTQRKWMRERGGRRVHVKEYASVIQSLRKLEKHT